MKTWDDPDNVHRMLVQLKNHVVYEDKLHQAYRKLDNMDLAIEPLLFISNNKSRKDKIAKANQHIRGLRTIINNLAVEIQEEHHGKYRQLFDRITTKLDLPEL